MTPYKTRPWTHQAEDLEASWQMPGAAIPWPPRLGKTKLMIDTAARLVDAGRIDAVVSTAPNGVHLNWTRRELPTHWPLTDPLVVEWRASRAGTVSFKRELEAALDHDGVVWLSVNVEALATKNLVNTTGRGGPGYLERFVKRRRVLLVVDESHKVKNPKAKRTKALMKIAERCPYRRTLSGTPSTQGPFDLWSQYHILDPEILGYRFNTFKHRYGVFERRPYLPAHSDGELVSYRDLDHLRQRIAPFTFWRRKEDCLDLPDRVFARRYFDMPPEHARVYRELRDELVTRLSTGEEMTAVHALTNLLRLQQISRGTAVLPDGQIVELDGPSPSVEAVLDLVEENDGKAIVWCRFVPDVVRVLEGFTSRGIGGIRCDGTIPSSDRPALVDRFRDDPDARVWVGTLATGGEGIDLGSATLMVFYSHGFDMAQRVQGLERNYGSSQTASRVDVVDLVAADTVDDRALSSMERKEDLASQLTGSRLMEMLR